VQNISSRGDRGGDRQGRRNIVHSAMDRALAILREKRDVLERSARKLSEKETLDENDLAALVPAAQRAADQSRGGVAA
jgi:ATP-dependent Zn protease